MSYEPAVAALRAWAGHDVVVRLDPEGTVLEGALSELDSAGVDGALFAVDAASRSGVALALFRDAVGTAEIGEARVVIEQGEVTVTVTRVPTCGGRRSGRA